MSLKLDDAARLLGVSPATLRRWAREGQLGVLRPSGDYRFDEDQLRQWAAAHGLRLREPRSVARAAWPSAAAAGGADAQPLTLALSRGGLVSSPAATREELLAALVAAAPLEPGAERDALLSQLLERETLTSTGLGEGIAVPHPRTPSAEFSAEPLIVLGLPPQPVDWRALDGRPVHAAFLLVNPSPAVHLRLLSRLAFVLRDPAFTALLQPGADFAEILAAAAEREPRG